MKEDDGDDVRSVALETAKVILQARQRAGQELVQAKESLELRTRELGKSLAMMQATLESTTDAILVTDRQGKVTHFNGKFLELWGMPPELVQAGDVARVRRIASHRLKNPQQFVAREEEIETSGAPESFDVLEFADGRVVERFSKLQRGDPVNPSRVWSFRDITERVAGEVAARRLAAIVDGSDDAIVGKDLNSIVTSWNTGAQRIFGYSASEMIGTSIKRLIPADGQSEEEEILARIRRGERLDHFETVRVAKGGELLNVSVTISPIKDSAGNVIGASKVARDITDRKRAEEKLKAAKIEAEKANQAKDDFLAKLSHELRTPLTPVLLTAAALREDERLPLDAREQLGMMERNITLEAQLIDDLLDITSITKGKLNVRAQLCDIHSLIGQALEFVRDEAMVKQIAIEREFAAQRSGLLVDPARFQQVVWNLLRNAVKFTPRGGRISIRTCDHGRDDGANWLRIEVADSGIGIDPSALERVFLPFEQAATTGRRFGGLGLGLAIARAIVELHGGRISARSMGLNQGTSFSIELPGAVAPPRGLAQNSPASAARETAAPGSRSAERTGKSRRLLLVEDHAPTLQVVAALLTRDGYQVVTANTIADALAAAAVGSFDLVISDLGLPDGTGAQLMEQLRDRHGLRGVALSGYGREEDIARSRAAGFVAHLVKPVRVAELRRVLVTLD